MRARVAGATALVMLGCAAPASAVDIDGNGYHDAILREEPYLPAANSGSNCDAYRKNGVLWARLNVRPPRVWIQNGYSRQDVGWRVLFYDHRNGTIVWTTPWEGATLLGGQHTDFGGRDTPGLNILFKQYWAGSHYAENPVSNGIRMKAMVQVRWAQLGGGWRIGTMYVQWVVPTWGRSVGIISVVPATRLRNAAC